MNLTRTKKKVILTDRYFKEDGSEVTKRIEGSQTLLLENHSHKQAYKVSRKLKSYPYPVFKNIRGKGFTQCGFAIPK